MNYQTKIGVEPSYIHLHIHEKCLIISKSNKNKLYKFSEADKMILELSEYLDEFIIDKMKQFIMDNCDKVKFDNKNNPPEQLSLF